MLIIFRKIKKFYLRYRYIRDRTKWGLQFSLKNKNIIVCVLIFHKLVKGLDYNVKEILYRRLFLVMLSLTA